MSWLNMNIKRTRWQKIIQQKPLNTTTLLKKQPLPIKLITPVQVMTTWRCHLRLIMKSMRGRKALKMNGAFSLLKKNATGNPLLLLTLLLKKQMTAR